MPSPAPNARPRRRTRRESRALVALHERLQAAAKRERERPGFLRFRRLPLRPGLPALIRPAIPLAGCLTPRALARSPSRVGLAMAKDIAAGIVRGAAS